MTEITVIGGFYEEYCSSQHTQECFGSGGRAAIALTNAGLKVDWHYFANLDGMKLAKQTLGSENLKHSPHLSESVIKFRYFHGLSKPTHNFYGETNQESITVKCDVALKYGMLEGQIIVDAKKCVFDPQSPNEPKDFFCDGSKTEELAVVLNSKEILKYGCSNDESEAINNLFLRSELKVVVVKDATNGSRIYENGILLGSVPAYWSNKVFKIGTGDVFSAAFAYNWALKNAPPLQAAIIASKCVATYSETKVPIVQEELTLSNLDPIIKNKSGKIYIAGPFFTTSELWIIEEAYAAISELGSVPFSPFHHVGFGDPKYIVEQDLRGLDDCDAVLAFLDGCDPGTIFEIGYAVKSGKPVVVLAENPKDADLTMILGSDGCIVAKDLATAIYQCVWLANK